MKWDSSLVIVIFFVACQQASYIPPEKSIKYPRPSGFPDVIYPEGSEPTALRILLGRILFYDKRLSANNDVSCGSCHALSTAFTDGKSFSEGIHGNISKRNAPTLANLAYQPYYLFEGGVPTLETQALVPLHDTLEMGLNMMDAIYKLNNDQYLKDLSASAFGRDSIDPWVVTRSLAIFQRSFISGDSYFDRYKIGQKDALNESATRGMQIFFSDKAKCGSCHSGVFFTDFGFYNIGLADPDPGKFRLTHQPADSGKFKTPTLRNIALTGPYMHNGSMNSLRQVLEFYNRGGNSSKYKDARIQPLQLNNQELSDLEEFLKSLTDWNFVQNERLLPLEQ